jgi:hypothetical protein
MGEILGYEGFWGEVDHVDTIPGLVPQSDSLT